METRLPLRAVARRSRARAAPQTWAVDLAPAAGPVVMLGDRTLVVWCTPATLDQRGAGVLGLEDGDEFDAIVLGEVRPRVWMGGATASAGPRPGRRPGRSRMPPPAR